MIVPEQLINIDGFVKSPSVPLRSGIALHLRRCGVPPKYTLLTPLVLRAGSRETRESFLRSHLFGDFLRDHLYLLTPDSSAQPAALFPVDIIIPNKRSNPASGSPIFFTAAGEN
jgi:hypothetical protein